MPLTGKQLEAGLKYKVTNRDILLTAAAFHIDEDHYLISDLAHSTFSTDAGKVRSQGFEVSANANVTKELKLIASYSYTDIRYAKTNKNRKNLMFLQIQLTEVQFLSRGNQFPMCPKICFLFLLITRFLPPD